MCNKTHYSQQEIDFMIYYRNTEGKIIGQDIFWKDVQSEYEQFCELRETSEIIRRNEEELEKIAKILVPL